MDPPLPSPYPAAPDTPPPAEWWERLAARIIDAVGFVAVYWILSLSFYSLLTPAGEGRTADARALPGFFAGLIAFGGYTLYDYVLHARDGRTVGKKLMRIRLAPYGGADRGRAGLMRRAALYPGVLLTAGIPVVDLLAAVLGFAGALFILMDKPLQRGPHDRLAGTVVVKDLR
ncbi:RDD family protein [Planomonospora algeriensis]